MVHRIIFYSHKWIKFQDIGRPSRVQFFKYDIAVIYSFYIFNQEMVITIFLCCFSALLFPIVRRHLISTYILHVGQLDTHFLSWWMKSHSSLSIHYISQTTSKEKSCEFLYAYLIKLQYKPMPMNRPRAIYWPNAMVLWV